MIYKKRVANFVFWSITELTGNATAPEKDQRETHQNEETSTVSSSISRNRIRLAIFGFFVKLMSSKEDVRPKKAILASRRARLIPAHI